MKLLCLTSRLDRPSTRYRIMQYIPYLNASDIKVKLAVISKGARSLDVLHSANKYDGVFVQKKLLSRVEQWYLRKRAKRIIYDFDDAVMFTKSRYDESSRRYARFRCMMENADLIIAGNRYLADITGKEYTGKVVVVPTVLDVDKYILHKRRDKELVVGWIGTRSTQGYLSMIGSVFEILTKKYSQSKVKIVSDERPGYLGTNVLWEKWEQEREMEQLLGFDIGIMPLRDDPWTKGKCGFKIIQYMAAGIPVVCSPVGTNVDIIKNEENGLYANTHDEWERNISRLIEDIDLYKTFASAGRGNAEKNYNLANWGPYLADIIKNFIK